MAFKKKPSSKSEKELAKGLTPKWHKEAQRKALAQVKKLIQEIKSEPLPNDRAVTIEHEKMVSMERGLAKMLKPMASNTSSKSIKSRKKVTKKSSPSSSKKSRKK